MSEVTNWSTVHQFRPYARHWPHREEEVAAIVDTARARGEKVKVIGAGHSWSDAICTDGHLISLDRMNRLLEVDRDRLEVTVEGGMRLFQLNEALAARGLSMQVLGSISEQSVAGAIATGTHGSGVGFGNLSSAVTRIRLIDGTGNPVDIDAGDPARLSAAALHIGALGVVTRVTLKVEPAFRLRERVVIVDFDDALGRLEELITSGEHVKLWWLPHTDRMRVSILDRTELPATGPDPLSRLARRLRPGRRIDLARTADELVNRTVLPAILRLSRANPELTPALNRAIAASYLRPLERVGRSDRIFNLTMPPIHRETEYGLPRERAAEAIAATRELIERERLFVNFPMEVRFVAADELYLSGAYRRDSCQLGAYIADCASCEPYLRGFEQLALAMDGRPHWGKELTATSAELRRVVPALPEFDRVRRQLDPDELFANRFVSRLFAG